MGGPEMSGQTHSLGGPAGLFGFGIQVLAWFWEWPIIIKCLRSWPCLFSEYHWTLWAYLWLTLSHTLYRIHRTCIYHKNREKKGRPRQLDAEGCLGLVLMWYCTRGAVSRSLCIMFGLTLTVMLHWLKFGKRVLLSILQRQYRHVQDIWDWSYYYPWEKLIVLPRLIPY
jgi:hypothetical protein